MFSGRHKAKKAVCEFACHGRDIGWDERFPKFPVRLEPVSGRDLCCVMLCMAVLDFKPFAWMTEVAVVAIVKNLLFEEDMQ